VGFLFLGAFMKRKPIDVEELKKVFRIRNGNLERINYRYPNGKWTVVANRKNQNGGYCQVHLNGEKNGEKVMYHNIIWILSTGKDIPSGLMIDHINGNKLDSRMENMRLVTNRVNGQNMKVHRDGQLVGCSFDKRAKRYKPQIQINSKLIYLGYFKTEQEAHEAYKIACKHIKSYVDSESFRELINKKMEGK
jgi:hypothetical protein